MPRRDSRKFDWSPPEWLENAEQGIMLVHDTEVEVYDGFVNVENIGLYRENNRTTLDLQHLLEESHKRNINSLSDDDIIEYILKQGQHKIQELANSIRKNGVKVPLILTYDRKLLDGNRRFLACKYLMRTVKPAEEKFTKLPVRCLSPKLTKELNLKIISEENFLPEYKEPWPREVRAKFAVDLYEEFLKEHKDNEDKAYQRVKYFLEIDKQDLLMFTAVLKMIDEYVKYVEKNVTKTKQDAERFGRMKFHFFEEFYNKTCKGRHPITDSTSLKEANQLLYKFILNEQLSSTIRVRELAEIVRYEQTKEYLKKPTASFELARSMYQDYARPKKAALKIIHFCEWLENLNDSERKEITPTLRKRLINAVKHFREKTK